MQGRDQDKLAAIELTLRDVRDQRAELDRLERDLSERAAQLRARIATTPSNGASRSEGSTNGSGGYGEITNTVLQIYLEASPKKLNAQNIGDRLEELQVPKRAKTYYAAARTSIRRLHAQGKLKSAGAGFYRANKTAEAQV